MNLVTGIIDFKIPEWSSLCFPEKKEKPPPLPFWALQNSGVCEVGTRKQEHLINISFLQVAVLGGSK